MADDQAFFFSEDIYKASLRKIGKLHFTKREIDIIACLVSARRPSAIASLLSISPNTVATHLRNIMLKVECNSQDGIIKFVDKSVKRPEFGAYYEALLLQSLFEKILREVKKRIWEHASGELILWGGGEKLEAALLKHLTNDLKKVGVQATLSESSPSSSGETRDDLLLYLCSEDGAYPETSLKSIQLSKIDNYYLAVVRILEHLYPTLNMDKFQEELVDSQKRVNFTGHMSSTNTARPSHLSVHSYPHWIAMGLTVGCLAATMCAILLVYTDLPRNKNAQILEGQMNQIEIKTWNIPPHITYYTDRKDLTEKVWSAFSTPSTQVTLAGLNGLGGVGKTTLAAHTIHHTPHPYTFKGWFSAETKELLQADYFALGELYNLFPQDIPDTMKIKLTKKWLESQESLLLVYDNAPDMDTIRDYLPAKGHILITSRNQSMPNLIEVGEMKEDEALNFLNKLIPKTQQDSPGYEKDIKQLAEKLGYFPLALSHAGYYIYENSLLVQDYLELYETNRAKLLLSQTLPPEDQHEPVYVTWDLGIAALKSRPHGQKAIELLNSIAYCYPENIPKTLLMQFLYGNTTKDSEISLNEVLKLLRQFSMVKLTEAGTLSVHRLLHEWSRDRHDQAERRAILETGVKAIRAIHPGEKRSLINLEIVRAHIPHAEFMLSQIQKLTKADGALDLMLFLGDAYFAITENDRSQYFFENLLQSLKLNTNPSEAYMARALFILGKLHFYMGNYEKSRELHSECLNIIKNNPESNPMKIAKILLELGDVTFHAGEYFQGKTLVEDAFKIAEENGELGSVTVVPIYRKLAWIHLIMGYYEDGLRFAEKAMELAQRHYDPQDFDMSETLETLGWSYFLSGRMAEAGEALNEAIQIRTLYFGENNIKTLLVLNSLGVYKYASGHYKDSQDIFEKALEQMERIYGSGHFFSKVMIVHLAIALRFRNKIHESQKMLEESLTFFGESCGLNTVSTAVIMAELGLVYGALGNQQKKRAYLEQSLAIFKEHLIPEHKFIAMASKALRDMETGEESIEPQPSVYYVVW